MVVNHKVYNRVRKLELIIIKTQMILSFVNICHLRF